MRELEREIVGGEGLEMCESYYWITSEDREEVLEIGNFMEAEKVMDGLTTGEFEEAVENTETAQIKENRPPYN